MTKKETAIKPSSSAKVAILASLVGFILLGLILTILLLTHTSAPALHLFSHSLLAAQSNHLLPTLLIYLSGSLVCLGIFSYFSPRFIYQRRTPEYFIHATPIVPEMITPVITLQKEAKPLSSLYVDLNRENEPDLSVVTPTLS